MTEPKHHSGELAAFRIPDACRRLGVSRSTIYRLNKSKKIRLIRIAGRTLVPSTEIERLVCEGTK